jgi:hypothetical protein
MYLIDKIYTPRGALCSFDYGASEFGSTAAESGAGSTAAETAATSSETMAAENAALRGMEDAVRAGR